MTRPALFILLSALAAAPLTPAIAQNLRWVRQAGTTASDLSQGVAVDSAGNAYIAGYTDGSLGGPNAGGIDAFLAKYDTAGALLWTRQTGTTASDYGSGVAVDSAGNAYICGATNGSLGGPKAGGIDVFLAKYDTSGTPLWTRQIGTSGWDPGSGVAVDSAGNAYMSGTTSGSLDGANAGGVDVFLVKYGPSGTLLWTRQIGTTADDYGRGVAVDGVGNAYIIGYTEGSLGGTNAGGADALVAKYNAAGGLLWTRQIGTSAYEFGEGVAVDSAGNAYITGYTGGSLGGANAGGADAFLAKYDGTGGLLWTRQTGTLVRDESHGVAVDDAGNAYITGFTEGSLSGSNAGYKDAFLVKYDASGTPLWTHQIGTISDDLGFGVAVDGTGNPYTTGYTGGILGGTNAGGADCFLAKFGISPCPADFNHDGFVTGDDFDSFSLAFIAGDTAADFDHNSVVNGDDFDAYVAAFEAGC